MSLDTQNPGSFVDEEANALEAEHLKDEEEELNAYRQNVQRLLERSKKTHQYGAEHDIEQEILELLDDNRLNVNASSVQFFRSRMKECAIEKEDESAEADARRSIPRFVLDARQASLSKLDTSLTRYLCQINYKDPTTSVHMSKKLVEDISATPDDVIAQILDKLNLQQTLPSERRSWVLKAKGTQEYIYGSDYQLTQFESVYKSLVSQIQERNALLSTIDDPKAQAQLMRSRQLQVELNLVLSQPIIDKYYTPNDTSRITKRYSFSTDSNSNDVDVRMNKQDHQNLTLVASSVSASTSTAEPQLHEREFEEVDSLSLWDLEMPLRIRVREILNLSCMWTRYGLQNMTNGQWSVFLAMELWYGDQSLASKRATQVVPISTDMAIFNQYVFFQDMPLRNLPRETVLALSVYATQNSNSFIADSDVPSAVDGPEPQTLGNNMIPLGYVKLPLFDEDRALRQGGHVLKLWPKAAASPIDACMDQSDAAPGQALVLCISFDRYSYPVYCPTGDSVTQRMKQELADFEMKQTLSVRLNDDEKMDILKRVIASDPLYKLSDTEKWVIWHKRNKLKEHPRALPKFLQSVPWRYPAAVAAAVKSLLEWAPMQTDLEALEFLDYKYPCEFVRQFALQRLNALSDHELKDLLLQLVQALKYELFHDSPLARFLMNRAVRSPYVIGHAFFWHLRSEVHVQRIRERHLLLLEEYLRVIGNKARRALYRENELMDQLLMIALKIKNVPSSDRKRILHEELAQVVIPEPCSLPLDSRRVVKGIRIPKCKVLDSKKLPLWLCFENVEEDADPVMVIFKAGDDLRQDLLTLQMIRFCDNVWKQHGLDLHMKPYGCVCTGDMTGMIEIVLNSETVANITFEYGGAKAAFGTEALFTWLKKNNASKEQLAIAIQNFGFSAAGYCCATHVLGIGDRHNDNIMMTRSGDLFHIDFGHFLGHFKKFAGIKRETSPFIFTPLYVGVLSGNGSSGTDTNDFRRFQELGSRAFAILRRHGHTMISLFLLMLATGIPELESEHDVMFLRRCLLLSNTENDMTQEQIDKHWNEMLRSSISNKRAMLGDFIHIQVHQAKH